MLVERHKLSEELEFSVDSGEEVYFHVLCGGGWIGPHQISRRRSVFESPTTGVYASSYGKILVAPDRAMDLVVVSSRDGVQERKAIRVGFQEHTIGDGTARREVREILGEDGPSAKIRVGETVNEIGGWSSWPPHHFDSARLRGFEEVFYVFTDPKDGYAIMRINGDLREVRSGDRVDVPLGEHPIVAGPGVRLMYFWAYVGADKIYPRWAEDVGQYK